MEQNRNTQVIERTIRADAEDQLACSPEHAPDSADQTPEQLIHELQVHLVELETQAEELRKSKVALEESRDKYLDLYEFAPLGYLTLTDKALIEDVNLTGAALLGVGRSKLVNARFRQFVAEKDSDQWDRYFVNVLNKGEKQGCTLMIRRGNGSMFPARLESVRLTGLQGGETTVRVAVSDVRDTRLAEDALRLSETQLRVTLEATADGILAVDNTGKVLFASRRFAEIWGIPESIMMSGDDRTILDFVLEQLTDPDAFLSKVQELYGSDAVDMDTLTFRDGRVFERYSFPMVMEGARIGRVWSFRDITGRNKVEASLRQANKKLHLLSSITRHDITNQVTVILGYVDMLKSMEPDPTFNEYFQTVATAAKRISAMAQFTREYEQIGVKAPAWQDCSTIVDTVATQASLGQVTVNNDLLAGVEVLADPLIVKVFYNLVDNAVRYGGKITAIRFSVQESGNDHLIVCEDDGDGIVAGEKEKIFDRGFGKNTGLGLSLSREILDITGIRIHETGEPGNGARFEMTVPDGMWRMIGDGT